MASKTLIPFSYFGSKASSMKWLAPLLKHTNHFVDVCGGSGVVGLNIKPRPIMTYNDINGDVVNFFRVLREQPDELIRLIELTPYSREEFLNAWPIQHANIIERARRFYIRANMSCNSSGVTYNWNSFSTDVLDLVRVSRYIKNRNQLINIVDKMQLWQIENLPADQIITKYSDKGTLIYFDPPYVHKTRLRKHEYVHEMSDFDHRYFADLLNNTKSLVAISGYRSELYKELYEAKGWHLSVAPMRRGRQECLWTNYNPNIKATLF